MKLLDRLVDIFMNANNKKENKEDSKFYISCKDFFVDKEYNVLSKANTYNKDSVKL